ncbi:MAG: LysR family transcriptional regulator [Pigmentiphaga sp.]|uniref:LysR family transcriptional regulator n=1 Tax=Pigmentiphaga sp. TaxID=1977564 RepID=UPI0029BA360E|nr:LysR family transcriptional regulator [Pigmentiphaga sp.]MDX3906029.1 LysR family transcriptional regulator [Pigmentiphaga sp.]
MNSDSVDFQLLRTFDAVFRARSVTLAAHAMGTSQPTISHSLNRLRQLLDDPLFVRVNNEMQPTPRAIVVSGPIRQMLEMLESQVLGTPHFDPATSTREIRFCMTDIGEMYYMPRILKLMDAIAPNMTFKVVSLTPDRLEEAMACGEVDLAMGYFPDLTKDNYYQQQLSTSSFVCIARTGNPHVGRKLTLARYLEAPHISAHTALRSMEVLERSRQAAGAPQPRIRLCVPHFIALLGIVAQTDLLATVPLEVARTLAPRNVRIHPLPFHSPVFPLRQHWHKRYHHDALNRWLRAAMQSLFQRNEPPAALATPGGPEPR